MKKQTFLNLISSSFYLYLLVLSPFKTYAQIPTHLEADFATALLAITDQKYSNSLKILDKLIESSPQTLEFLELKASVFKKTNEPLKTVQVYENIIKVQTDAKKPFLEIAPYHYELGLLYFEQKNYQSAIQQFRLSVKSEPLEGISFFYLGMSYFTIDNSITSEKAFKKVLKSSQKSLIPVAHFYLGQIYFKRKNSSFALEQMSLALDRSREIIADPNETDATKKVATQIADSAQNILQPLHKSRFFTSLGLRLEYDTNILSLPEATIESTSTGIDSFKYNFLAGVGFMSSPLDFLQFIPSYRLATNLNSNENAQQYEYITNTFSLYINRKPLNPFTYGLKGMMTYTYENKGTLLKRFDYNPYTLEFEVAPYVKIPLTSSLDLGFEYGLTVIDYKTTTNDDDSSSGRNAITHKPQFNLKYKSESNYLNPNLSGYYRFNIAKGNQYTTRTYGLSIDNDFSLTEKLNASMGFSYSYSQYFKRLPARRGDQLYGISLSFSYPILASLSAQAGARWSKNKSNLDSQYSYDKMIYLIGINYQF